MDGFDCLGLFIRLQKERFGREIHDPLCTMNEAAKTRIARKYQNKWNITQTPEEGDAVLFRAGRAWHIGFSLALYIHLKL